MINCLISDFLLVEVSVRAVIICISTRKQTGKEIGGIVGKAGVQRSPLLLLLVHTVLLFLSTS